jgi:hypothetical protein
MKGHEMDVDRGKAKEKNTQNQGNGAESQVIKEGFSKNPTKSGGINRPTTGKM